MASSGNMKSFFESGNGSGFEEGRPDDESRLCEAAGNLRCLKDGEGKSRVGACAGTGSKLGGGRAKVIIDGFGPNRR